MLKITASKSAEKLYILKNLEQFPMVVVGSALAGVTPSEYIDRFFEVMNNEPEKILSVLKGLGK